MGRTQIIEKLAAKLDSVPRTEEEVVFILSKIRKILELDAKPPEFQILNFYCNLALHPFIHSTPQIVQDQLRLISDGRESGANILGFGDLQEQLLRFFMKYGLPNFYAKSTPKERAQLYQILLEIYNETPIFIEYHGAKYSIVISQQATSQGTIAILTGSPRSE